MEPRLLVVAGALLFFVLGAAHLRMTVADMKDPKRFAPAKPELLDELKQTRMNFRKDLKDFWATYIGFHFSHSLGLMFYGLAVSYCALFKPDIFADMAVRLAVVIFGGAYVLLSHKFWFSIPLIGSVAGVTLIAVGMAMQY